MREALDVGRPRRPGWYRKSKLGTAAAQRALQLDLPMTTVDSKDVATQPSVHPHALIGSAAANLPCVALHDTAAAARPCTRQILGNRKARATDEIRRGREPAVLGAEGCSAFPTARSSELDDQAVGLASILRCPGRPGAADQAVGGNDAVSDPISRYPAYLNPLPLRGSVPSPALGGEFRPPPPRPLPMARAAAAVSEEELLCCSCCSCCCWRWWFCKYWLAAASISCHSRSRLSCCAGWSSSSCSKRWRHCSYSTPSISWNILRTLTVSPCTAGFQWLRALRSRAGSTAGTTAARCCATSPTMASLFHRNSDRSATWKWELLRQRAIWRKRGCTTFPNSAGCVISSISSNSPRNNTSFWLLVRGQKRSRARSTASARVGSFSTNWVTQ
mmetsp:Transcript_1042/g.3158  ORF Transcript_1042/g.3158 Transcript_1042/m.3158 type:complete len:389 (-) Transcript_1042:3545-4711(-)